MVVEADGIRRDGEIVDMPGTTPDEASSWTPPTWEEIVREHSARVYRLAYRLTGNTHDAEDLPLVDIERHIVHGDKRCPPRRDFDTQVADR